MYNSNVDNAKGLKKSYCCAIVWYCFNEFDRDTAKGTSLIHAKETLKKATAKYPHFCVVFHLDSLESSIELDIDES